MDKLDRQSELLLYGIAGIVTGLLGVMVGLDSGSDGAKGIVAFVMITLSFSFFCLIALKLEKGKEAKETKDKTSDKVEVINIGQVDK